MEQNRIIPNRLEEDKAKKDSLFFYQVFRIEGLLLTLYISFGLKKPLSKGKGSQNKK